MDEKTYQSLIPDCCQYRTAEEHKEILMLCWGIVCGMVKPDDDRHCRTCEFYVEKLGETVQRDEY